MKKIIITEKEYGKEFVEALENVLTVRKLRKKVYGDAFLNDRILFLAFQIENKTKRLIAQLESGELNTLKENTETAKDSCLDIVNYALFLIAKINRGDKK